MPVTAPAATDHPAAEPTTAAPLDGTIPILAWTDPIIDQLGHDPRSRYVEDYWLAILGPSTTWLLRRIATGFDASPDGFLLPVAATALELGLGVPSSAQSPFIRSIARACKFRLARWEGEVLCVRRQIPPLSQGQVRRLPDHLRAAHDEWQRNQLVAPEPRTPAVAAHDPHR